MSLDKEYQNKHEMLYEQENQKLIETYMCCDYYIQHQINIGINKYQVKNWYFSMRKKELDGVNAVLKVSLKEYSTDFLVLMWCDEQGDVFPKGLRFTKQYLETMHQISFSEGQNSTGLLSTPFPIEVTIKMMECFNSDAKLQSGENANQHAKVIGEIAQELWVYSKNCELLYSDEDRVYLTETLHMIEEKISSMLYEAKLYLSAEIYNDLSVLCDMTYNGEVFDDTKLNNLMQRYQYIMK